MHSVLWPQTLAPFSTTGISSPVLDHWALELQQFDIQFKHISGKKNVVADATSRLRTLGLYQDNGNDDLAKTDNDVVDNVVEEVHTIELIPNLAAYKKWRSLIWMYCKRSNGKTPFAWKWLKI